MTGGCLSFDDPLNAETIHGSHRVHAIRIYTGELRHQCLLLQQAIPCLEFIPTTPSFLRCKPFSGCWIQVQNDTPLVPRYSKQYVICWEHGMLANIDVHMYGFYTWFRHTVFTDEFRRKQIHEFISLHHHTLVDRLPKEIWMHHVLQYL